MNNIHQFESVIGDHEIIIETGRLAGQAGGAVTIRSGESVLLVTATGASPRPGIDFFPLTVDFEARLYAAGKIPGGFFRREGRPSEAATLICRLVDRPVRPLFPKDFRNEIQIVITPLSADQETHLDILALIGASTALSISDIPFGGPIGAVRVGYIDGKLVFNPTISEMENSALNLRLAGTEDAIVMVEADAHQVPESLMIEALQKGHEAIQDVIRMQLEMQSKVAKAKVDYEPFVIDEETYTLVQEKVGNRLANALVKARSLDKSGHRDTMATLFDELVTELGLDEEGAELPYTKKEVRDIYDDLIKKEVRRTILREGIRPDGRDTSTVRPLNCEVGLLPRVHGSGLFSRGETQVLTSATLGTSRDEQIIDDLSPEESKRYMHHYNFPPYSTGEVRPMRGPKRREIGHGALAEHALLPVLPSEEDFPYTMRLVSDVMSSNGSTSMASVCGSTLSLMDAGVPIKAPVAGIAMGLVTEEGHYAILTDIQGMEDHLGDMDFKVAGTRKGITALQMDIKISGLGYDILEKALAQARDARLLILDKIEETIPEPRAELSPYAPRITIMKIDPEKIGAVIGPGGKTIRSIVDETGVKIDIEDDGTVLLASTDGPASERAQEMIRRLVEEPEVGKIYLGKVTRVESYGAFVEILPKQEGLIHISQLADYRVRAVEDIVSLGDEVMVMVVDIDPEGKIKLSRQAVLENWTLEEARDSDPKIGSRSRGRRGGDRRGSSRHSSDRRRRH